MKTFNVLLINCPNRLTRNPEFFPYGLAIISKVLKQINVNVQIYDLNLHRNYLDFQKYLNINSNWDIVALSGLITTYSFQKKLAKEIRNLLSDVFIISGGGLASSVPELLLSRTEIEVVCIGEGEKTIVELAQAWFDSRDLSEVKGIYWKSRQTNEIIKNKLQPPILDLDLIPFPDWDGSSFKKYLGQYSAFYNKGKKARKLLRRGDLTTTRGCPYDCSFCSNTFNRQSIRARSVENVIEEIRLLKMKYSIDSIDFLDEHFCYSRNRVIEFCEKILKLKLNIHWGTASRTDCVDKELLQLMKKAGCIFILFGFETGSQKILDKMGKKIFLQQSWEAFKLTEEAGIDALGNLIIGHPGENDQTIIESLDFQRKRYQFLKNQYKNMVNEMEIQEDFHRRFATVSFVVPFPGSRLYEKHKRKIGDLEEFMTKISLNDASSFVVNLSELSNVKLLGYQQILSNPHYWDLV